MLLYNVFTRLILVLRYSFVTIDCAVLMVCSFDMTSVNLKYKA